jgi:hypothetical protein
MSPSRGSLGERQRLARLRRRLTPDAAQHRAYLRQVDAYLAGARVASPRLVHDGRVGRVMALDLWRSVVFRRSYLVAWVEASWYHAVAPASDALTSTLSGTNALPPLVIVPHRRRRPRSERFRAIIEHECVHINQAILGTLLPSPRGTARERLANVFFARWRSEYEAHALQVIRWPQFFPQGFGLSLEHWCALRGYTDALEAVAVAVWRGEFRPRDLVTFLDCLPGRFPAWLRRLGVDPTLAAWFRRHLVLHVAVALLNLARTRPGFGRSAAFRTGLGWIGSAVSSSSARRTRAGEASVQGVAVVSGTTKTCPSQANSPNIARRPRSSARRVGRPM